MTATKPEDYCPPGISQELFGRITAPAKKAVLKMMDDGPERQEWLDWFEAGSSADGFDDIESQEPPAGETEQQAAAREAASEPKSCLLIEPNETDQASMGGDESKGLNTWTPAKSYATVRINSLAGFRELTTEELKALFESDDIGLAEEAKNAFAGFNHRVYKITRDGNLSREEAVSLELPELNRSLKAIKKQIAGNEAKQQARKTGSSTNQKNAADRRGMYRKLAVTLIRKRPGIELDDAVSHVQNAIIDQMKQQNPQDKRFRELFKKVPGKRQIKEAAKDLF